MRLDALRDACLAPDLVGLTFRSVSVLIELGRNPAGLGLREIAERLDLSAPVITRSTQALEAKGLVVRARSNGDIRRMMVRATPEGEALINRFALAVDPGVTA